MGDGAAVCSSMSEMANFFANNSGEAGITGWRILNRLEVNLALSGSRNSVSKLLTEVNSLWPNFRLVIALHSPNALIETLPVG